MKIKILLFVCCICTISGNAQKWIQTYFHTPSEIFSTRSLLELPNEEGYLFSGSYRLGNISNSPSLTKVDQAGNYEELIISTNINESNAVISDIILSQNGGFVIAGNRNYDLYEYSTHHFIARISDTYEVVWKKEFAGIAQNTAAAVHEQSDGSIISTGSYGTGTKSISEDGITFTRILSDGYAIKLDAQGNTVWEYRITGYDISNFGQLMNLSNSDLLLIGYANTITLSNRKLLLVKLNSRGEEIWKRELIVEEVGDLLHPYILKDNIVLVGRKIVGEFPNWKSYVVTHEISEEGDIVATMQSDFGINAAINRVSIDGNGNLFATGRQAVSDHTFDNIFLLKFNEDLELTDQQYFDLGEYQNQVTDLYITSNDEALILGWGAKHLQFLEENRAFLINYDLALSAVRPPLAENSLKVNAYTDANYQTVQFAIEEDATLPAFLLSIFNIQGQLVHHNQFKRFNYSFDYGALPRGNYLYKIQSKQGKVATGKISLR